MRTRPASAQQAAILRYFEGSDGGAFPADLFTSDFEFWTPKYGLGRGLADLGEMAAGFGVRRIAHHLDTLRFIEDGDHVAVEGTTEGVTSDGVEWHGGRTAAGRFASTFTFNAEGLISRMYIYVDPDFAGRHTAGFRWDRGAAQRW